MEAHACVQLTYGGFGPVQYAGTIGASGGLGGGRGGGRGDGGGGGGGRMGAGGGLGGGETVDEGLR